MDPGLIQKTAFISQGTREVGRGFLYLHRLHHSLTLTFVSHYKIYHEAHRYTNYPEKTEEMCNLASLPNQTLQQEKQPIYWDSHSCFIFLGVSHVLYRTWFLKQELLLWHGLQKWLWGVPRSAVIPCDRLPNWNWASWRQTVISSFLNRDSPFNT